VSRREFDEDSRKISGSADHRANYVQTLDDKKSREMLIDRI